MIFFFYQKNNHMFLKFLNDIATVWIKNQAWLHEDMIFILTCFVNMMMHRNIWTKVYCFEKYRRQLCSRGKSSFQQDNSNKDNLICFNTALYKHAWTLCNIAYHWPNFLFQHRNPILWPFIRIASSRRFLYVVRRSGLVKK